MPGSLFANISWCHPLQHSASAHGAGRDWVVSGWGHPRVPLAPQFILPHSRGSSHGQSRINRSTYAKAVYARMMPESFRLWQQLETEASTSLYR